jgi:hypothetical protein
MKGALASKLRSILIVVAHVLPLSRTIKASEIALSSFGPTSASVLESGLFKDLVRALVGGTPLQTGLQFGITYKSEAISLKVSKYSSKTIVTSGAPFMLELNAFQITGCVPAPSTETVATAGNIVQAVYYQLTNNARIRIRDESSANSTAEHRSVAVEGRIEPRCGLPQLTAIVNRTFAGYCDEVREALGVVSLGLGCSHLLRSPERGTDLQPSSSSGGGPTAVSAALMRAPRGLILYGPPGTGKTTLMRALVAALGCNYIELSHSVLLSR